MTDIVQRTPAGGAGGTIVRLDRPSRATFEREHVRRHLPCIVTGLTEGWAARTKWDADYLRRTIGGTEVAVWRTAGARSVFTDDAKKIVRMRFAEFLDLDHSPAAAHKHLMMQRSMDTTFPALVPDIEVPPLFEREHLFQMNFWYAPGENLTLLHCDFAANLLTMVKGKKRVVLYPPGAPVYPHPVHGNFAQVLIDEPDMRRFPRFHREGVLDFELHAGEMLYIPGLWWHQVYSEPSIAVNFWWWPRGMGLLKTVLSRQMLSFGWKRVKQKLGERLQRRKPSDSAY
jgi:hypothetical protein